MSKSWNPYLYKSTGDFWAFDGIDRLLIERKIDAEYYEHQYWRTYRVPKDQLHLLPFDDEGPYLASADDVSCGWSLYIDPLAEHRRTQYGAEWMPVSRTTDT